MSAEHVTAVFDQSSRGGSHLVILLTIATYSDHHGEWSADQATLQKRARLTRRRVQQLLDELVAAGELAVVSHHGRGKLSNYRLLIGPANLKQAAPFSAKKLEAESTFPTSKREADSRFSRPPCPPFPPHPQSPLNPPEKLETYGLHPGSPENFSVSPLQAAREGDGRRAGGEGSEAAPASPAIRPLTPAQTPAFRVHLLLEEAAVPLPTPSQIGLWSKTLGGIEPLLDLLRQLIEAGLATKREPIVYVHRVVMERAARPQPAPRAAGRSANRELLRTAGVDDIRRVQAARIAAEGGDE